LEITTMTTITLTDNEKLALRGIAESEFMDGSAEANRQVWSWSCNPFKSKKTFGGVVASLVKKSLAVSIDNGGGDDDCLMLTDAGLVVYNALAAETPKTGSTKW